MKMNLIALGAEMERATLSPLHPGSRRLYLNSSKNSLTTVSAFRRHGLTRLSKLLVKTSHAEHPANFGQPSLHYRLGARMIGLFFGSAIATNTTPTRATSTHRDSATASSDFNNVPGLPTDWRLDNV